MRTLNEAPAEVGNLASRLRGIAQGRDTLDVAQFQFIDLEEIRGAYGERWPENKTRILDIAEGFLRRRVDPSDLLISASGGFLVVFGAASGMAAEAAAGALSHGLNEFFLGEIGELPAPRFDAVSHPVPVQQLAASLTEAVAVPSVPPVASDLSNLPQFEWRYQPVWDVKRETLSSWYVAPHTKATHERVPGYQFEGFQGSTAQFVSLDETGLFVSEQALHGMIAQGRQALIGASFHITSLTNLTTRARLFAALDRLDRQYFRYRVIKIAGIAPGFPRLYLNEIVSALRAKIPNVVLGAAWDEPDISKLLQSGPVAVGVSLPKSVVGPAAAVPVQTMLRKLSADAQCAHGAHMRFFVEGLVPHDLAVQLACAGADNISSPRIWPATAAPDGMMKWPAARLAA